MGYHPPHMHNLIHIILHHRTHHRPPSLYVRYVPWPHYLTPLILELYCCLH